MPSPLLPTHARGQKPKRRGSGAKEVMYVIVALIIGYLVFVGRHAVTRRGAEADLGDSAKETQDAVLKTEDEAVTPQHQAGKHLGRQDAMKRVLELQKASEGQHHSSGDQGQGAQGIKAVSSPPAVHVNVEQHEQQHVPEARSFFDLSAVDIDGNSVQFSKYAGKVVIVVNVASACGYTDQNYKGLQKTYDKYKGHGLEILGFPCNQFGGQEAKSESEIKAFCSGTYHVTFPMFSKIEVNGPHTHPVYQFLKKQLPASEGGGGGSGVGKDLGWNFFKFLVDKKGQPVKLFPQAYEAGPLEQTIYALLEPPPAHSPDAHGGTVTDEYARVLATSQSPEAKSLEAQPLASPLAQGGGGGLLGGDTAPDLHRSFFDLSAVDIDGNSVQFSKYAGKVVIVVNVASACGYTDQNYKGLEKTYLKYKEHGLEILGFPCNQFGGQEAKSESEIKAFCSSTYHVTFPMFSKIEVNGPHTHPVYQFLKKQLPASEGGGGGVDAGKDLGWNFFKFLVNKKGQPVRLLHQELDVPLLQEEIYRLLHE